MHFILLFILVCTAYAQVNFPEDAKLDFRALAVKYGQEVEEFDVATEDGYVLKVFHIAGDPKRPVLLVHGLLGSSDCFIMRGNLSLAVNLARNGYDVWAINHRGNRYSKKHLFLNPDKDPAFWNFYVHEYGTKDLPATIDFIANKTGSKVSIIGYSEGTTTTLVFGASKPEYNEKINIFIALAPICFLQHTREFVTAFIRLAPAFNKGLRNSRTEELFSFHSPLRAVAGIICNIKEAGYLLCIQGAVFQIVGADPKQLEPDFIPIWLGHFPAGTSRKNMYHLSQISNKKRFAQYDYGRKTNIAKYGWELPPEYDLSKVTMKTALFVARNDVVSTIEDVDLLRKRLPNVVEYKVMDYAPFNHIDFVWGKTTYSVVLPHVSEILQKYST